VRYYNLVISDPNTKAVWKTTATSQAFVKSAGGSTFSSHSPGGAVIAGALNVEFDIPTAPFNAPQGAAMIRVWGVGLGMIGQSADLFGQDIALSAGMKKGLPLAKPAQAGLILQGTIFQAFGNWQGINQSLDIICNPAAARDDQDISFYWPAGMTLATALATCFAQAFPLMSADVSRVADITMNSDGSGRYSSLAQLADYVQDRSQIIGASIFGEDYSGVQVIIVGNKITAYDSTSEAATTQLDFNDLIGQPTWINPGTINFKTVMRSDIAIGSKVKFPEKGLLAPYVLTTQAAAVPGAQARSKTIFQGDFLINRVQHFANFRQPDADAWNTTFDAVAIGK
jgi:hypothetical protein